MLNKRVLVFGTFDGLHHGHLFFLRQAKTRGTELVVAVARDAHVSALKNKVTQYREQTRKAAVEKLIFVDQVVLSDVELGSFEILDVVQPDMIVLGHDQFALEESLKIWMGKHERYIPIQRLSKLS